MSNHSVRILTATLTFVLGISAVVGWLFYRESQKIKVEVPDSRRSEIFFRVIDKTTEIGGLEQLRKVRLTGDDIEVRIWRGFGLGNLEGVILKSTNDQWRAFHVKANDYIEPQQADVKELNPPKSGWEFFWKNLTKQGLLTLRDPSEVNCEDAGIDGTGYVVEINQNKFYRTYRMREGGECSGVRQMEKIDDLIGEEFDSGQEQCKRGEWFACAKSRKSARSVN